MEGSRTRVMIVDDEELNLKLFRIVLDWKGYEVAAYQDSLKALDDFKRNPHQFDLILTDENMPGLHGIGLAAEVLQIRPEIPIVLCSASIDCDDALAKAMGFKSFLPKPANVSALIQSVEHALGKGSGFSRPSNFV